MTPSESFDVVVIGAGPAGCTAAQRLSAMGRRVAVVERRGSPRPRGGESLSPGTAGLLDYLAAADVLDGPGCLRGLPARVAWERRGGDALSTRGSVVVDRAEFDGRLLVHARKAGAQLFRPARVHRIDGEPGSWRVRLACADGVVEAESRLVLDARGRAGPTRSRVPTGPATLALWTDISVTIPPTETRLEATARGWLWGTPLPGGCYRVVAFVDPAALKQSGGVANHFRAVLEGSTLFGDPSSAAFLSPVRACSATPYLDAEPWRPGALKTGETALGLDPLSSSGVEKSMRLALQAAVAANTVLDDPGATDLAREFYETALISAAADHAVWTREHYGRAWPGSSHSFWRDRAQAPHLPAEDEAGVVARFRTACVDRQRRRNVRVPSEAPFAPESPDGLLEADVVLSAAVRLVDVPCVVGDRVESRPAIVHPSLEQPVAFLAGHALAPLVGLVPFAHSLGHLLVLWSTHVPLTTASRIAGWFKLHGLLEPVRPDTRQVWPRDSG